VLPKPLFIIVVHRHIIYSFAKPTAPFSRNLTPASDKSGLKKLTLTETTRLNRLRWFGHVKSMEEYRIPNKVLYMNFEATRLRARPRNRWQDEVREDGKLVGGKGWKERVYNRQGM